MTKRTILLLERTWRTLALQTRHSRNNLRSFLLGHSFDLSVSVDDAENVQKLPLVFVDSLDLDVKHGVDRDVDTGSLLDVVFANLFGARAWLPSTLFAIPDFCVFNQLAQNLGVRDPSVGVSDPLGDDFAQFWVAKCQPPSRRDAVGFVLELVARRFLQTLKRERLDDIGVNLRDAIDGQTCDAAQVSHSHRFWWRFGFFHGVAHLRSASGIRVDVFQNRRRFQKRVHFLSQSSCL